MRVTTGMIRNNSLTSLNNNMSKLDKLYTQMNTMKKANRPSDDPVIVGRAMKLKINIMETDQYNKNIGEANAWMGVTETALSNMTEIVKDIRTRCSQAANGTLTQEDRQKVVEDITQLIEQLKQESNVSYSGRHIFSGYKTDKAVYLDKDTTLNKDISLNGDITLSKDTDLSGCTLSKDVVLADGTVVSAGNALPNGSIVKAGTKIEAGSTLVTGTKLYTGTMNPEIIGNTSNDGIKYEVGINTNLVINTSGVPEIMGSIEDILSKITKGLTGDNTTTPAKPQLESDELSKMFSASIGDLDNVLSRISEKTSELGSKQKRLDYTEERLTTTKTNLTELLSNTEDVNFEEVYVEFNEQYSVYQSALQATSKLISTSLADFLR